MTAERAVARERQQSGFLADALWIQGMVLVRQAEAERALDEGLKLAVSQPYPYAEGRILEQMGRMEEALAIFQRLGAKKDIERIEAASAAPRTT